MGVNRSHNFLTFVHVALTEPNHIRFSRRNELSIKIMTQVWEVALPTPAHKLVLMKFADHANDDGVCYPGAKGVAKACSLKERQVRKVISELREWGFIKLIEEENAATKKPCVYSITPALGRTPVIERTPAPQRRDPCTVAPQTPALE